jgi:SEC-C motif-containing protein
MTDTNQKCLCCSEKLFSQCCHPYLTGEKIPETAEQLMRSRYTAYASVNIDYIIQTMHGPAAEGFDKENAISWAQNSLWCGLNVVDPGKQSADIDTDEVEFIAKIVTDKLLYLMHERSSFQREQGKWFYFSGETIPHKSTKITGLSLCPCGSKKKFGFCCGRKKHI